MNSINHEIQYGFKSILEKELKERVNYETSREIESEFRRKRSLRLTLELDFELSNEIDQMFDNGNK